MHMSVCEYEHSTSECECSMCSYLDVQDVQHALVPGRASSHSPAPFHANGSPDYSARLHGRPAYIQKKMRQARVRAKHNEIKPPG